MKRFFCVILVLCLGFVPISAEPQKSYADMTYAELAAIDASALSRRERKRFRKAYKAAKKNHEKEMKAQKAAQRNLEDMSAAMDVSFRQTKIENNEETGVLTASSWEMGAKDFMALGARGWVKYYVVASLDKSGTLTTNIIVKTMASEAVEDEDAFMPAPPRNSSRARRLQWDGYELRYHRRDAVMTLASEESSEGLGKAYSGLMEEVIIPIELDDLLKPVRVGSGINILLSSKRSTEMELDLPFGFLVGYLSKISTEGFLPDEDKIFVGKLSQAIKSQARN